MALVNFLLTINTVILVAANTTSISVSESNSDNVTSTSLSFSHDNFIIYFSPFVKLHDSYHKYSEQDLIPMIETISSKFSNIATYPIDCNLIEGSLAKIPTAVAKFNLQKQQEQNQSISKPMTVVFEFEMTPQQLNVTAFNAFLSIAHEANSIYPGTVQCIGMNPYVNFKEDDILEQIKAVKNIDKENLFKLTLHFELFYCGQQNLHHLKSYSEHVDVFTFYYNSQQTDYDQGVGPTVADLKKYFEKCKKTILSVEPLIKVQFNVAWADTDNNGKENFTALVHFWEEMNKWAVETNTTISMFEAFDQPYKANSFSKTGWWRLVPHSGYMDTSEYIFEEKKDTLIEDQDSSPPPKTSESDDDKQFTLSNAILSAGFAGTITFVLILIGLFLFYAVKNKSKEDKFLTKKDLQEFFEGGKAKGFDLNLASEAEGILLDFLNESPYMTEFELEADKFQVEEDSILGAGAFGEVCLGKIIRESGDLMQVAVKSVKGGCVVDTNTALKGIMSEIKVMGYLGRHENLVGLVGAYTKELKKGRILVFTELCSLGSMEKFLRKHSTSMGNCNGGNSEDNETVYLDLTLNDTNGKDEGSVECGTKPQITSDELLRWSLEIANGMEYLSSKQVVHADIATRNVLLTIDKIAKISDFGLSRRLYDYVSYVKTGQEPLPWRWMSPECLFRSEFDEKTDVWAFGFTLWEMYSLGDLPYAGLSWNTGFASNLVRGLRLEEPRCNANEMYSVMLKCWNNEPLQRPTFTEVRKILLAKTHT